MSEIDPTTTPADEPVKKATKRATKKAATKKAATKTATASTEEKVPAKRATRKATAAAPADEAADAPSDAPSPAKKATAKKAAAKKATAKKAPAKRATKATAGASDPDAGTAGTVASAASSSPADESADAEGRPRTRTRSRSRRPAGEAASAAEAPVARGRADDADEGSDDGPRQRDGEDAGDGAGDGAPRRRRRGGRGRRGRGRSGEAASGDRQREDGDRGEDGDDSEDDAPTEAPAKKGRDAAPKKQQQQKKQTRTDDDGDDEDRIPRGGTRMAAKKARRSGGQGATRGGGGGGGRRQARPGGVTEEERRAILAGPPRTMIVTAKPERTQIAVMEDRTLVEHYVTRDEDVTFVGNIYMGRVQNVLPGMEAAFIDIGKGRNGVLYAGEVLYDELDLEEESDQRIENVLKPGQKVLVQVTKDPMGTKGPRLTMHLSLAGRYVVLAPDSNLFGISRKLTDTERDRLRRIVKAAKPEGHGVIVRTAAEGATEDALTADVERLVERWRKVEEAAARAKPLEGVYEEPKLVVKVIRDIFGQDFVRCIVDSDELHGQVRDYLSEVAPELVERVELYGAPTDDERSQAAGAPSLAAAEEAQRVADEAGTAVEVVSPAQRRRDLPDLFTAFDVTDQLRQAMNRKVWLPSGGYLIIETTEAMKVIDVNTGRFTGGSDSNLEEVVLKTNLEAADEIVRQLRLRDMGGMIIIDFIDMLLRANQEQVVRRLKRELLRDRTKTRVSDVSRLGLVQMTRKNVSQGLVESFSTKCEKCDGHGFIANLT
jgi:Rne/Rng family ribonuclease